jgi:hypothetical protein
MTAVRSCVLLSSLVFHEYRHDIQVTMVKS